MKRLRSRLLAFGSTCAGSGRRRNFSLLIEPDAWLRKRRPPLLLPAALRPATWEGQDETGWHQSSLSLGSGLQPCGASRQPRAPWYGGRASRIRLEPWSESLAALRGARPDLARYV